MTYRLACLGILGALVVGCASSGSVSCPKWAVEDVASTTTLTSGAVAAPQVVSRPDPSWHDPDLATWGAPASEDDEDYGF